MRGILTKLYLFHSILLTRFASLVLLGEQDSPLSKAPHTVEALMSENWDRKYTRNVGAFPAPWSRVDKFWPTVGRIDNVYGDRNLMCTCPPIDVYMTDEDADKKDVA